MPLEPPFTLVVTLMQPSFRCAVTSCDYFASAVGVDVTALACFHRAFNSHGLSSFSLADQPLGSSDVPLPALTVVFTFMTFAPFFACGRSLDIRLAAMRIQPVSLAGFDSALHFHGIASFHQLEPHAKRRQPPCGSMPVPSPALTLVFIFMITLPFLVLQWCPPCGHIPGPSPALTFVFTFMTYLRSDNCDDTGELISPSAHRVDAG